MFLFSYATVDLMAERLNPTMSLDDVSVNGFLRSRPYMTDGAAAACDASSRGCGRYAATSPRPMTTASSWSTPSPSPTPTFWLARGPASRQVIAPLTEALDRRRRRDREGGQVTSVSCTDGRVTEIGLRARPDEDSDTWVGEGTGWSEEVDELVLAVPPSTLLSPWCAPASPATRIVEAEPRLAEVSAPAVPADPDRAPLLQAKLRHIPVEPVGLFGSELALAFTDISQTWEGMRTSPADRPLPFGVGPLRAAGHGSDEETASRCCVELAEYLDFDPGTSWGESADIDWDRTRFEPNMDARAVRQRDRHRRLASRGRVEGIANLTLRRGLLRQPHRDDHIESAVTTGLEAARVIVERRGSAPLSRSPSPTRD